MEYKQVLVLRKDLHMRKGKMVAQGAHASQLAIMQADANQTWRVWYEAWMAGPFTKICVSVDSKAELFEILNQAAIAGLPVALVEDSGLTEFHGEKTLTAVGIGPAPVELVDAVTGELKLL